MKHMSKALRFAFGESRYLDRERFGPLHGFQLEVVFIRRGQVQVVADDVTLEAEAPGILLVTTSRLLEYRYRSPDTCEVLWCQCVSANLGEETIAHYRPFVGVLPVSEASAGLMRIGADLSLREADEMPTFVASLAETLLLELTERKARVPSEPAVAPRVAAIHRYIEENCDNDISMSVLAEEFALSPQHINRLFQAAFKEGPLDFLWRTRVQRGAFMLKHTGMRISQIAYACGFKTPNHFCRLVRREYGLSPRELRVRDWDGRGRERL